jgi:hypothetical protein
MANTSTNERPHLGVGQLLNNKYEIVQDINTGSFGHVVMCQHEGTKVAVKIQDRAEPRYHQGDDARHSIDSFLYYRFDIRPLIPN